MLELLLRGASIVDGSGAPAFQADVGVSNGRIVEVGKIRASTREAVDCAGMSLMPGIVDVHTHYDAQITWDVHGVWVNGLRVFDGAKYIRRQSGPGAVIKNFDP